MIIKEVERKKKRRTKKSEYWIKLDMEDEGREKLGIGRREQWKNIERGGRRGRVE